MMRKPITPHDPQAEAGLPPRAPTARARWRHAFGLAASWWTSPEWPFAWGMLLTWIAVGFGNVYLFVLFNTWQQGFFDAIEQRRAAMFAGLVLQFVAISVGQVGYGLLDTWLGRRLGLRWRAFLTRRYLDRWLADDRYHEIERLRLIDNPDQRIAEDIRAVTGSTVDKLGLPGIVVGYLTATAGAISFIVILLRTSQWVRFDVLGIAVAIPGDMVVYGFLYVIIGSICMVWLGRPYVARTQSQQHYEGDFRAGLIHVRRNAAQIGFADNVDVERRGLGVTFDRAVANYRGVIRAYLGLSAGQGIYERLGGFMPLFITTPRYFAGLMSFGQVMGARDAFQSLVGNLSFFIQSYPRLAEQIANLNRLKALDDALDHDRPRGITRGAALSAGDVALATQALRVDRPCGAALLEVGDWTVRRGERWVVWGPSGAGKSTLLRAIAGLWPDGAGSVAFAGRSGGSEDRDHGVAMFVPQRLYLPIGTLKDAISFPQSAAAHDDAAITGMLDRVGLGVHRASLHVERLWQDELSPGEQQRIALARILLQRPDLLILDEGTSALDGENSAFFYREILAALPGVTLVSVVHDDRLVPWHTHRLAIANGVARPEPLEPEAA